MWALWWAISLFWPEDVFNIGGSEGGLAWPGGGTDREAEPPEKSMYPGPGPDFIIGPPPPCVPCHINILGNCAIKIIPIMPTRGRGDYSLPNNRPNAYVWHSIWMHLTLGYVTVRWTPNMTSLVGSSSNQGYDHVVLFLTLIICNIIVFH
jgi:hypothetical protein